jgi:hypothetical protein
MAVKKKTTKTAKPSTIAQVAKRFNITAREVRDIATAVSTAARTVVDPNVRQAGVSGVMKKGMNVGGRVTPSEVKAKAGRNIAKQIGEVYTAATKGKSGTKSAKIKSVKNRAGDTIAEKYKLETKRKKGSSK